jgi:hypothetical protein
MSGYRHRPRVRFTAALWDAWRSRLDADEQTLSLRRGIQEFRETLEAREPPVEFDLVARRK